MESAENEHKKWIEKKTSLMVSWHPVRRESEFLRTASPIFRRRTPLPAFEFAGEMELVAVSEPECSLLDGKVRVLQQVFRGFHPSPEKILSRRTVQMIAEKPHQRGPADMKPFRRFLQKKRGIQMRLHKALRLLKQCGPFRSGTCQHGTGNEKLIGFPHERRNTAVLSRFQQAADFAKDPDGPRRIGQRINRKPVQIQRFRKKIQFSPAEFQHELPIRPSGGI